MNKVELVNLIKSFVDGSCGDWDWDDFISVKQRDPELEDIRQKLLDIHENHPSGKSTGWCNDEGLKALLEIAQSLSPETSKGSE